MCWYTEIRYLVGVSYDVIIAWLSMDCQTHKVQILTMIWFIYDVWHQCIAHYWRFSVSFECQRLQIFAVILQVHQNSFNQKRGKQNQVVHIHHGINCVQNVTKMLNVSVTTCNIIIIVLRCRHNKLHLYDYNPTYSNSFSDSVLFLSNRVKTLAAADSLGPQGLIFY